MKNLTNELSEKDLKLKRIFTNFEKIDFVGQKNAVQNSYHKFMREKEIRRIKLEKKIENLRSIIQKDEEMISHGCIDVVNMLNRKENNSIIENNN